jgi:hypothetical protein
MQMTVSPDTTLLISAKNKSPDVRVMSPTTPLAVASRKTPWRCAVTTMPPVRS